MKARIGALYYSARGWILALAFIGLVWNRWAVSLSEAPLRWEMLAFIAAGMLLRAWAGAHLGPHANGAKAEAPHLVTTGPYAFSRNPLYLSNIAIGSGLVFFANSLGDEWALAVLVFLLIHHIVLARFEETIVRGLWPAEYDEYSASTPRWFSLKPPTGAHNITDTRDWSDVRGRQGRNLLYAALCVVILWVAAIL